MGYRRRRKIAIFNTTTLSVKALLVSMLLAVLIIPVDMIRKAIVSKK